MKGVTITLTRYNESNDLVKPCIVALSKQKKVQADVYFLDQRDDKEIKDLCKKLSSKDVKLIYKRIPAKSLSFARNEGIKIAKTDAVLFIDCDAIPQKLWAHNLAKTFELEKRVAIVGGKSNPKWLRKPMWFHRSNIAREVYSLIDLSEKVIETNRVVGVNFGMSKKLLGREAFFDVNLGRRPGSLLGGEESDLCKRAIKKKLKIYYTPHAVVFHQIQLERMSIFWLMRRFYYGGIGKGIMGGMPKTYSSKRNIYDRLLLFIIVIPYIAGYIKGRYFYNENK